jgi:hypothetical protein
LYVFLHPVPCMSFFALCLVCPIMPVYLSVTKLIVNALCKRYIAILNYSMAVSCTI